MDDPAPQPDAGPPPAEDEPASISGFPPTWKTPPIRRPITRRHNSHNADAVDGDDEPVDKSGPFRLTAARRKLITDLVVGSGQAHAVPAVIASLERVSWGEAEELIRLWAGIQTAIANGQNPGRSRVTELLTPIGAAPPTEDEWQAMLTALEDAPDHADCRVHDSGYCDHGVRVTRVSS